MKSQLTRIAALYGVEKATAPVKLTGSGFSKDAKYKLSTVEETTPRPGEVIEIEDDESLT